MQTAVVESSGAANPHVPVLKLWVVSLSPTFAGRDLTLRGPDPQQQLLNLPLASDHSITSSASASNLSGISRPRALAATTLITSSYLVGISTGKSPGFVPLRMGATYCEPARR